MHVGQSHLPLFVRMLLHHVFSLLGVCLHISYSETNVAVNPKYDASLLGSASNFEERSICKTKVFQCNTCFTIYDPKLSAMSSGQGESSDIHLAGIPVRTIRLPPTSSAQSTNRFDRSCISAYYNCLM